MEDIGYERVRLTNLALFYKLELLDDEADENLQNESLVNRSMMARHLLHDNGSSQFMHRGMLF